MLKTSLAVLVAACVLFASAATAAPPDATGKVGGGQKVARKAGRHASWNVPRHWHKGYGFLPGFSPAERRQRAVDRWRDERRGPYYLYGGPGYWSSFSRPGFYRNRWNGGGLGPCWTRTPIGPVWNCG